jgi:hypothetical protein
LEPWPMKQFWRLSLNSCQWALPHSIASFCRTFRVRPTCLRLRRTDNDIVLECEPCAYFMEVWVWFLWKKILNSCQECLCNGTSASNEWWRKLLNSAMFFKYPLPVKTASPQDTKSFMDIFQLPSMIPQANSTFFQVFAELLVVMRLWGTGGGRVSAVMSESQSLFCRTVK